MMASLYHSGSEALPGRCIDSTSRLTPATRVPREEPDCEPCIQPQPCRRSTPTLIEKNWFIGVYQCSSAANLRLANRDALRHNLQPRAVLTDTDQFMLHTLSLSELASLLRS